MKSCVDAFRLLTILPFPSAARSPGPSALYWFPVVGLGLGLILAGVDHLLSPHIGVVSPILLLALWIFLTRALHLDGLGDTFDALGTVADRTRRLEILRDPHIGSIGVVAIVIVLIGKFSALSGVWGNTRALALVTAAICARWVIVIACALFPYPRPQGLGAAFIGHAKWTHVGWTTLLVLLSFWLVPIQTAILLLAVTIFAGLGTAFLAHRSFGGITGDVLGAVVEITECAVLMVWTCQK